MQVLPRRITVLTALTRVGQERIRRDLVCTKIDSQRVLGDECSARVNILQRVPQVRRAAFPMTANR